MCNPGLATGQQSPRSRTHRCSGLQNFRSMTPMCQATYMCVYMNRRNKAQFLPLKGSQFSEGGSGLPNPQGPACISPRLIGTATPPSLSFRPGLTGSSGHAGAGLDPAWSTEVSVLNGMKSCSALCRPHGPPFPCPTHSSQTFLMAGL